jgi:hypothetical protein
MKILIFIPSFNDQKELSNIIKELYELNHTNTIYVIDDGSVPPIFLDIDKALLFRIPFNAGLGAATSIALHIAKTNNFDFMIRIDADGQHPIQNVKKILDKIFLENGHLCIGQRLNNESQDTFRDIIATIVKKHMNFLSNLITGNQIKDWSTGFFVLNKFAIQELSLFDYARYPEIEIYFNAHYLGLKILIFNIEQSKRIHGFSSLTLFQSLRLLIRFYLLLVRQILRKII